MQLTLQGGLACQVWGVPHRVRLLLEKLLFAQDRHRGGGRRQEGHTLAAWVAGGSPSLQGIGK